jgi:copper chaperone CopZ
MATLTLKVTGMHCDHCQMKVEKALLGVPGTRTAAVFLEDNEAEVDFDPAAASAEKYVDAVRQVGYEAAVAD